MSRYAHICCSDNQGEDAEQRRCTDAPAGPPMVRAPEGMGRSPKYEREDKPRQRRRTVVMDESAPGQGLATLCDARALESRGTS
jgi:hypothetical protein